MRGVREARGGAGWGRGVLLVAFGVAGAPALAAQLTWVRVFSAGLGHEWPALVGVVSAFFVGLALGAWGLDGVVSRTRHPARWYGGLELFSAVWMAGMIPLLPRLNALALSWTGLEPGGVWQAAVALAVPWLAVGPSAMAMGGAFPAMDRAVAPLLPDRRAVALLYALNTAGAMAGVALAVGVAMPAWGFAWTLAASAMVQAACGIAGGLAGTRWVTPVSSLAEEPPARESGVGAVRLGATAAATGFLGLGFELVGVRWLAQLTDNTLPTYAVALAVFLGGTALGGAWLRARQRRGGAPGWERLLWAQAAACVVAGWALVGLGGAAAGIGRGWGPRVGDFVLALLLFALPTLVMGAVFGSLVQEARRPGGGVGRMLAWNTLGAGLAGPLILGGVVPVVGLKWSLGLIAVGYLAWLPGRWGRRHALGMAGVVAAWIGFPPTAHRWPDGEGVQVLRQDDGRMASVAVIRTPDGHRALRVNGHFQQGGTATATAARRHAHLPLLLHPEPRRALFLGVGTGVTLGAATRHPGLRADGVELLPEVLDALPSFEPENHAPQRDPGVRLWRADARRFVRASHQAYDVIVADLFHPAEDGAGFLYTREHFAAIRERLAPGGLFCQWLPLHQLDLGGVRDVARTFLEVFPDADAWLLRFNADTPVVGLVGWTGGVRVEVGRLAERWKEAALARALSEAALNDPLRVLGCRLADPASLRRFAAGGDVATDDRPLVLFRAAAGREGGAPPERLRRFLEEVEPGFAGWVEGGDAAGWTTRLEAFRTARDLHLRGLAEEAQGQRAAAVALYLRSVRASPDYTAGYAQAVLIASAYARVEPDRARGLLEALRAARPDQRLAGDLLERLDAEARSRGP